MKFIKTIFESLSEYSTITANFFPLPSIKEKATFVTHTVLKEIHYFLLSTIKIRETSKTVQLIVYLKEQGMANGKSVQVSLL